jgi:hypothetical protein
MRSRVSGLAAVLALGLVLAPSGERVRAADAVAPYGTPQVSEVLGAMSRYLAQKQAFAYHAEVEFDQVLPDGPKIRLSGAVDVAVARPGSLFVDYRDDVSNRIVWLKDGVATVFDPVAVTYARISGPKDIDGMVEKLEREYGAALPLGELAETDPNAVLTRGMTNAHYVGVHDVEGVRTHHLVLQRDDLDLQVFVEIGDQPVPRKLVFEYPNRPGSPQYTAFITDWRFEAPDPGLFRPKVPEDAAEIEFLPLPTGERRS